MISLGPTNINSTIEWCSCKQIYHLTNNSQTQWANITPVVKCTNHHILKDSMDINSNQTTTSNWSRHQVEVSHMDIPTVSIQIPLHLWWRIKVILLTVIWMEWWTTITQWQLINSKFIWVRLCKISLKATTFRNQIKLKVDTKTDWKIIYQ